MKIKSASVNYELEGMKGHISVDFTTNKLCWNSADREDLCIPFDILTLMIMLVEIEIPFEKSNHWRLAPNGKSSENPSVFSRVNGS